jgi:hypothetical protein
MMQKVENHCSVGAMEVVFWSGAVLCKLYLCMQIYDDTVMQHDQELMDETHQYLMMNLSEESL